EHPFDGERRDNGTQESPATAGERTPPDVRDREQEPNGDRGVGDAEGQRGRRERVSLRGEMERWSKLVWVHRGGRGSDGCRTDPRGAGQGAGGVGAAPSPSHEGGELS